MGKTVFMFPGQGAQYIGMGKDFYDSVPVSREVFELAGKAGGLDILSLCFEENDKINITEYTQIAMLAAEVAILMAVEEKGVKADIAAGLSLGEYGAMAACGVMGLEDLFRVIRQRGIYMQEAVPTGGAMTAVLGGEAGMIEKICEEVDGIVSIANYNCPGQIVISGEENAVKAAADKLMGAGVKRCVPLKVSGPFHSPMLSEAGRKLGEVLKDVTIHEGKLPYIANVTADYVKSADEVKPLLEKQVSSPVRWQQSVERMLADGADTFIEIGPGKTLSGFMKKIDKTVKVINIEKLEDMDKLDALL